MRLFAVIIAFYFYRLYEKIYIDLILSAPNESIKVSLNINRKEVNTMIWPIIGPYGPYAIHFVNEYMGVASLILQ